MPPKETTLHVRNMVCPRCVRVVREELTALGLDVRSVVLGAVTLGGAGGRLPMDRIKAVLEASGFEILEDHRARVIEKIKLAAQKLARHDHERHPLKIRDSEFIAKEVGTDYRRLTTLFSQVESLTIERYIILQRIEYVKELLKYGELTLSEIAYHTGYSSAAHCSSQFRRITGMTPTAFRSMGTAGHRHG